MRCLYCYNDDIVLANKGTLDFEALIAFLKKRVGLLDAVVLSGGEATMHDLNHYCTMIKQMGFKIKLDTNGLNPHKIQTLVEKRLIDYIALDFKAPKHKFKTITKNSAYDDFLKTLTFLCSSDIDFEVRTTLHADLLSVEDINSMIDTLCHHGYEQPYYIQNFVYTQSNLGAISSQRIPFDDTKLKQRLPIVFR
jgi:pyruvate formate lyase activating enzyme